MANCLKTWVNAALHFLYPGICQVCKHERANSDQGFVCDECRGKVRFIQPPFCDRCGLPYEGAITTRFECAECRELEPCFATARSAVEAKDPVLEIIHKYKYNRALWFEKVLADLLIERARPELLKEKWDSIVPVPLHPTKEREREFNQAERLGACLSRATGIPTRPRLLQRVVATKTQTLLSRAERLANVRRAFAMREGEKLPGHQIVLIDDVLTTGATTSACAKVLRNAGAAKVCVWTVARGV
jgi:ComF family protein